VVTNGAKVTLAPGTYVIKDGPLTVRQGSSFTGECVGFYLTGATANIQFIRHDGEPVGAQVRCDGRPPFLPGP
jgi:hypothetical protein